MNGNEMDEHWHDTASMADEIEESDNAVTTDELYFFDSFEGEADYVAINQYQNYLHPNDFSEITAPSTENWADADNTQLRTRFSINKARAANWKLAIEESERVAQQLLLIFNVEDEDEITFQMLLDLILGPSSKVAIVLMAELELEKKEYLEFMITYCIQAAYRVSSTQVYSDYSILRHGVSMGEKRYNELWKMIAHKSERSGLEIGTGRRGLCLWQKLEGAVNEQLRDVSIANHRGNVAIALDDDKVWYNMSKKHIRDTFGLKITRHVKDNRIGMILHTAVSCGLNIPLSCCFERVRDTTQTCYQRIFQFLFGGHGKVDLRNVNVHSDRGYSLPSVVFDFLIANGANVVVTVKRYMVCWPFTFNQKNMSSHDKRTLIDSLGAPTLYIKHALVGSGTKRVAAAAFRNGSGAVSTAASSMHSGFEWEGITEQEGCSFTRDYDKDPTALRSKFFQQINDKLAEDYMEDEDSDDKHMREEILEDQIDPLTVYQGAYLLLVHNDVSYYTHDATLVISRLCLTQILSSTCSYIRLALFSKVFFDICANI